MPDAVSRGNSNPKTISDSPAPIVDLKNPTPSVLFCASKTLIVTSTGVFVVDVRLVLKNARFPASYAETFCPLSLVDKTSLTETCAAGFVTVKVKGTEFTSHPLPKLRALTVYVPGARLSCSVNLRLTLPPKLVVSDCSNT